MSLLVELCYFSYGDAVGWKTWNGQQMKRNFCELPDDVRLAWRYASVLIHGKAEKDPTWKGEYAKDAYDAYVRELNGKTMSGSKALAFGDLPENIKNAWCAFALSAYSMARLGGGLTE